MESATSTKTMARYASWGHNMANNPNQTIPSTLAPTITSFTPSKESPSFSSIINEYFSPVTYANAGANTLLASDVIGGLISHTAAGAETDTLPSATLMAQAIQAATGAVPASPNPAQGIAGSGIRFFVRASGAGTITIAVGAGGTLDSLSTATVATLNIKEFLLIMTNMGDVNNIGATYTLYSLGTSVE